MTEVKGTMNYTLRIDPTEEGNHGISFDSSIENDIAALMVAAQALTVQSGQWKEFKKKCTSSEDKKKAGANIALMGDALRGIKPLTTALCNTYEGFKKAMAEQSVSDLKGNEQDVKPLQD